MWADGSPSQDKTREVREEGWPPKLCRLLSGYIARRWLQFLLATASILAGRNAHATLVLNIGTIQYIIHWWLLHIIALISTNVVVHLYTLLLSCVVVRVLYLTAISGRDVECDIIYGLQIIFKHSWDRTTNLQELYSQMNGASIVIDMSSTHVGFCLYDINWSWPDIWMQVVLIFRNIKLPRKTSLLESRKASVEQTCTGDE